MKHLHGMELSNRFFTFYLIIITQIEYMYQI